MRNNHSHPCFNEATIFEMFAPIVETKPKFVGGSTGSVMLIDTSDFKGECLRHETNIPFFEIFNFDSPTRCEYQLEGKNIRLTPQTNLISYYANSIDYSFRSPQAIKGYLLGFNPALFNRVFSPYSIYPSCSLPYKQDLKDTHIKASIARIIRCIDRRTSDQLSDIERLHIDRQALALLDSFFYDRLRQEFQDSTNLHSKAITRVIEWIDTQIELNSEILLEEILEVAAIEGNHENFLKAFKRVTGKDIPVYCRDRRLEIFESIQFSKFVKPLSPDKLKTVFQFIHSQVLAYENNDDDCDKEAVIIEKVAEQLGCELKYLKNACSSMHISPYSYYRHQCLESAKHLLIATNEPISTIAERTGYSEESLRKALKKKCGLSPSQFRYKFR